MILPDLNLLLYAYNSHDPRHEQAKDWWESALRGESLIGLPHEIMFGFVRFFSNPGLGAARVNLSVAKETVESWLGSNTKILIPGPDHFSGVMRLMEESGSYGKITSDAVLAYYAISNRARLCTTDSDFSRFPGLDWQNPL